MRVKWFKIIVIITLIVFTTTGCWDSHDIDEKNIVTAVIIDKTDTGYAFMTEIAKINENSGDQGNQQGGTSQKSIVHKSEGPTFEEAREYLERKSNAPIYLGAVQCVIFTEKMAYNGIEEYIYRIRQIPEYRKTLEVVVTPEKPEDLFKANTGNKDYVGFAIEDLLETLVDEGHCIHLSLAKLFEKLASPYKCYFVPTIGLRDNELALIGYSVFYDGICKGFIPAEESEGLILLKAEKPVGTFTVPYKENSFTIETHMTQRNTDVAYENGQIIFNIEYACDATLLYLKHNVSVTEDVTREIRMELEKILLKEISDTIIRSQTEFGYDYLYFYNDFRIEYPDVAKNIDWLQQYPNVQFNIEVSADLDTTGKLDYYPRIEENEEGDTQ